MAKAKKSRKQAGKPEASKGQLLKTAITKEIVEAGVDGPLPVEKVREMIADGIHAMAGIKGYEKSYSQAYKKMDFELYIWIRLYEVIFTLADADFSKIVACLDATFEPHADLVAEVEAQTPKPERERHQFDLSGLID